MSRQSTMRTLRRLLVAASIVAVVGGPASAQAVVYPLVRLTLAASPNPAAEGAPGSPHEASVGCRAGARPEPA